MQRKEELHKLLLLQVPGLLSMLGTFLENILEKHRRIVSTATPPPSPTHGESSLSVSPRSETELDLFSLSPPHGNNNRRSPLIGRLLNHTSKTHNNLNNPLPPLDPDSVELSSLALACLAHLFSWIPLSSSITPSLLATVFCFAEFGCDVLASGSGMMAAGSTRLGKFSLSNRSFFDFPLSPSDCCSFVRSSVRPSVRQSVRLPIPLSINLSMRHPLTSLYVRLYVRLYVSHYVCRYVCQSLHSQIHLSVPPFSNVSVRPSVHPSIRQSIRPWVHLCFYLFLRLFVVFLFINCYFLVFVFISRRVSNGLCQ